jgi:hypothetical protein
MTGRYPVPPMPERVIPDRWRNDRLKGACRSAAETAKQRKTGKEEANMLARSFLSATDLGISEMERGALIATLYAFERGEIETFTMRHFREICGTPACICGWANHFSEGRAFAEVSSMSGTLAVKRLYSRLPKPLQYLFDIQGMPQQAAATQAQAAAALSNYLTFGEPRWDEVTRLG